VLGFGHSISSKSVRKLPQYQYEEFEDKKSKKFENDEKVKVTDKFGPTYRCSEADKCVYEIH
jgi:hypothetical protein